METTMLQVNGVCNAGCSFCALSETASLSDGAGMDAAFRRLESDHAAGAVHLRLGGGEPMLFTQLADVVRRARALGFTQVTLETNATMASFPGRATELAEAGLTHVLWALNGPGEAANGAVFGFEGAGEASLKGAKAFASAGVRVIARSPMSAGTLEGLPAIAAYLREQIPSVDAWWLRPLDRQPSAPFELSELPSWDALRRVLPKALLAARRVGLEVRIEDETGLPLCLLSGSPGLLKHWDGRQRSEEGVKDAGCMTCAVVDECRGQPASYRRAHGPLVVRPFATRPKALMGAEARLERLITYHQTGHGGSRAAGPQVTIRVIMPCNQSCTFCFVDRTSPSPDEAMVFSAIDEAATAGADRVSFSGGEPTLHPRLADYIRRAAELEIPGVEIQTNALRLVDEGLCDTLVDAGLNKAVVSFHAVDPERYLQITGAGTPEEVLQGVRNLLDRGVRVEVNVVHCQANLRELEAIVDLLADRVPEVLVLLSVTYIVSGVRREWEQVALRYSDAVPHLAGALRLARKRGLAIRLTGRCSVPPCVWAREGSELRHLDIPDVNVGESEDGHVYFEPCTRCAARPHCYGLSRDYVNQFGEGEFRAISAEHWEAMTGG